MELDYRTERISKKKELLLNVAYKLKKAELLLPAGFSVSGNQLVIRPYNVPEFTLENVRESNITVSGPAVKDNDHNFLIVEGEAFVLNFNRRNGFLCKYQVEGCELFDETGQLTPNFWRAPTDNDFGANLQHKYRVWLNPEIKLTSLVHESSEGMIIVKTEYDMPGVSAKL